MDVNADILMSARKGKSLMTKRKPLRWENIHNTAELTSPRKRKILEDEENAVKDEVDMHSTGDFMPDEQNKIVK